MCPPKPTSIYASTQAQTLTALRPVVGVPSWAITTFHGSHCVDALPFAVTPAVVFSALVHV